MLEAFIVLTRWFGDVAEGALDACRCFGKGRHPAGLDFSDCMSFVLATVCDEALLPKGDDFTRTDIAAAGMRR